jgi:hypothetical protein
MEELKDDIELPFHSSYGVGKEEEVEETRVKQVEARW